MSNIFCRHFPQLYHGQTHNFHTTDHPLAMSSPRWEQARSASLVSDSAKRQEGRLRSQQQKALQALLKRIQRDRGEQTLGVHWLVFGVWFGWYLNIWGYFDVEKAKNPLVDHVFVPINIANYLGHTPFLDTTP